ncbi:MAG TPA: DUF1015 domain-containing protein [Nocardioides sp.]|uniref:DUF1015 domain-containing protein n=1 Tax=Nocardioides sp. TaxID=35761 RepID=UPI002CA22FA8|nr:DUF1015 domain-containing protein [Nocardioides sp.]HTW13811.1 DUF1015 domain-containing protein [Nocardioides sp.]
MESSTVVTPPYVAGPLRLEPFRALRLAPSRIANPASGRAFARPYTDVAARLAQWQADGQMHHDDQPALYLHEYTAGGMTIRGLVGLLDISHRAARIEDAVVLPHEGIHPAQADELADRMAEMGLNPAPILLVHRSAPDARAVLDELRAGRPDHVFTDRAEQRHRIWALQDPARLAIVQAALAGTRTLIADGHHRYAAYLRLQQRRPGGAEDRGLAMLVDHDDTPLFLGAIHRVLAGVSLDDLERAALLVGARFASARPDRAVAALRRDTMVVTDGDRWATITFDTVDGDRTAVEVLHDVIVPALPRGPRAISHHHSAEETLGLASADADLAVLLPAPDVDQVLRIVAGGRLLPEKATSFQPKASVGVLIRSLNDG